MDFKHINHRRVEVNVLQSSIFVYIAGGLIGFKYLIHNALDMCPISEKTKEGCSWLGAAFSVKLVYNVLYKA